MAKCSWLRPQSLSLQSRPLPRPLPGDDPRLAIDAVAGTYAAVDPPRRSVIHANEKSALIKRSEPLLKP
jgi:hypothetical protein